MEDGARNNRHPGNEDVVGLGLEEEVITGSFFLEDSLSSSSAPWIVGGKEERRLRSSRSRRILWSWCNIR